ncbi:MAG: hypothetical protein LBR80_11505 [Deltaproteobacteria bacterium]|nr:hypothetical protein [Deltaproteobacteria bacterium]
MFLGVWCQAKQSQAEIDAGEARDSPKLLCHVEDFIQKLILEQRNAPLTRDTLAILPYLLYRELLLKRTSDHYVGSTADHCLKLDMVVDSLSYYSHFKFEFDYAWLLESAMKTEAFRSYQAKYANIDGPPIDRADIPAYEERAGRGDLEAMHELRRYYEYPERDDFNPELTEARFWMFKAIEAGDEASMLEAGYDRPYSVRSELSYGDTTVAIDVACEGIDRSGHEPYPACFLYNLLIGENPGQVGHLVLDQDHLSGVSVRPQIIAFKRIEGQIVLELFSFADRSRDGARRDYFSLEGRYLGSDRTEFGPDYFWNYHGLAASAKSGLKVIDGSEEVALASVRVRTLPYIESFLFWETEFPAERRLRGLDGMDFSADGYSLPDDVADNGLEYCDRMAEKTRERYDQEQSFFLRMQGFLEIDPFEYSRIDNRDPSTISPLEKGYSGVNSLFYGVPCQYGLPRLLWSRARFHCEGARAFEAYEELDGRPSYVIEVGSEVESVRMLQVCRYLGHYSMDSVDPDNPDPCYTVQIRKETEDGYNYHYIANAVHKPLGGSNYKPIIHSTIKEAKADVLDGNRYLLVYERLMGLEKLLGHFEFRLDVFDEDLVYLGSTNHLLSKSLVPGYHRLSPSFDKQLDEWIRKDVLWRWPDALVFDLAYPECGDVVAEQRRNRNSRSRGENG